MGAREAEAVDLHHLGIKGRADSAEFQLQPLDREPLDQHGDQQDGEAHMVAPDGEYQRANGRGAKHRRRGPQLRDQQGRMQQGRRARAEHGRLHCRRRVETAAASTKHRTNEKDDEQRRRRRRDPAIKADQRRCFGWSCESPEQSAMLRLLAASTADVGARSRRHFRTETDAIGQPILAGN